MEFNQFAITFYFKDILPDYTAFEDFLTDYTDVDTSDEDFNKYCFKYLFNRYCNSNVKYDTQDAFCRQFGITYENVYEQFKKRQEIVKKMYALDDDDIMRARFIIANNSLDDNVHLGDNVDPLGKPLDYISQQTASKELINKVEAYDNALRKITDNLLDEFLDEFRKHFISLFTANINVFD